MAYDTFVGLPLDQSIAGAAWDNGGMSWDAQTWFVGDGAGNVKGLSDIGVANYTPLAGQKGVAVFFKVNAGWDSASGYINIYLKVAGASQYTPTSGISIGIGYYGVMGIYALVEATGTNVACTLVAGQEYCLEFYKTDVAKQYEAKLYNASGNVRGLLVTSVAQTLANDLPSGDNTVVINTSASNRPYYTMSRVETIDAAAATAPGAPTIGTATAGNGSASVAGTAPASDGGSAITGYTATAYKASDNTVVTTGTSATLPVPVTGLTNGVPVYFKLKATNAVGTGAESAASNTVTPAAPAVAPTGTAGTQEDPSGQSQRFLGTTTNATSGTYTLTGSNGGVTKGPTAFAVAGNAFDFTVPGLVAGDYTPTLTVTGPGGTAVVTGTTPFSIMPVTGGGEAEEPADTTNPTVSLGASSTNVTAAGSITLTATAADNVGVDHVEFYRGATLIGTDTGSPFTASETVAYADNGTRSYTAKAYDAAGRNTTSSPVVVTINIPAPAGAAPTVVIADAAMVGSKLTASGTVNLQGSGTLAAYLDPQPSGASLGPFTITPTGSNWSYEKVVDPGKWKLRTVATANGQTATATSGERTMLGLTGNVTLPTV